MGAFDVVRITITEFLKRGRTVEDYLAHMQRYVVRELVRFYPEVDFFDTSDMVFCMADAYAETGRPFVVVVDEWDAPMRERPDDEAGQRAYLDFLRDWYDGYEAVELDSGRGYADVAYLPSPLPGQAGASDGAQVRPERNHRARADTRPPLRGQSRALPGQPAARGNQLRPRRAPRLAELQASQLPHRARMRFPAGGGPSAVIGSVPRTRG